MLGWNIRCNLACRACAMVDKQNQQQFSCLQIALVPVESSKDRVLDVFDTCHVAYFGFKLLSKVVL